VVSASPIMARPSRRQYEITLGFGECSSRATMDMRASHRQIDPYYSAGCLFSEGKADEGRMSLNVRS
jgi:hypothetical protein